MSISLNFKIKRFPKLDRAAANKAVNEISNEAVKLMKARILRGRQADGSHMPPYSTDYWKKLRLSGQSTKRDTSLTGGLVRSLRVLKVSQSRARIGWKGTYSQNVNFLKGRIVRNGSMSSHEEIVQRLASNNPKRKILGLTNVDKRRLNKVAERMRKTLLKK